MVTFLSRFLRSFCLFVCFLSPEGRKAFLRALADSCLRSFLYGGSRRGAPSPSWARPPRLSQAESQGRSPSPCQRVVPWHPLKEARGEQGSGGACPPPTSPPACLRGSPGAPPRRWKPFTLAIVSPSQYVNFKQTQEKGSRGTQGRPRPPPRPLASPWTWDSSLRTLVHGPSARRCHGHSNLLRCHRRAALSIILLCIVNIDFSRRRTLR